MAVRHDQLGYTSGLHPDHARNVMYPAESCLEVSGLSCERGYRTLFDNLCFRLEAGEIAHVTGLNGAGKTTLLRAIAGLFEPQSGNISLNGHAVAERPAGITYLGHKIALKGSLTARENLEFTEKIQGRHPQISVDCAVNILNAKDYCDTPVVQLSAGQKQRIALVRALRADAQLWLLDEPATALDRDGVRILEQLIEQHAKKNGMILYTGHQPLRLPESCLKTIPV